MINYVTNLAIDVSGMILSIARTLLFIHCTYLFIAVAQGAALTLKQPESRPQSQHWNLTIDGYFVHGFEPSLVMVPQPENGSYKLMLANHRSWEQEHRWGLLLPEIIVQNSVQILVRWTAALLQERRSTSTQKTIVKTSVRFAAWPQETFLISTSDGYGLAPEKPEAFSTVVLKKMELGTDCELFKWTYETGYLVHVATGLVLHVEGESD